MATIWCNIRASIGVDLVRGDTASDQRVTVARRRRRARQDDELGAEGHPAGSGAALAAEGAERFGAGPGSGVLVHGGDVAADGGFGVAEFGCAAREDRGQARVAALRAGTALESTTRNSRSWAR